MPWEKPYKPPNNRRLEEELYSQAGRITFITLRAYSGESPFDNPALNDMIINLLNDEQKRMKCIIYTYCLMPDHLHYLISQIEDGVSVIHFTNQFKGKSTNSSWKLDWNGKLWQPRFYDHIVRTDENLIAIAEYILNNPVRKELIDSPDDWEWGGQMNPYPS